MKKLVFLFLLIPVFCFAQGFQVKTDTTHFLNQNKVVALQDSLNKKIAWADTGTSALDIIKLDGAGKLPAVDGSQLTNLASGATILTAIKTANETVNNSTTLQNDDHLFISVAANTTYIFELFIIGQQKNGTAQLQASFTVPTGTTMNHDDFYSSGGNGSFYNWHGTTTSFQQNWTLTNDHVILESKGIIQVDSTAGTIQLQWAQGSAYASDLIFLKGSYLKLTKVQ